MCLAVPMKLLHRDGLSGTCDASGVKLNVSLVLTPDAQPGDYLIIHAGYALTVMSQAEAIKTTTLFDELRIGRA